MDALGPYAKCFGRIIGVAAYNRKDVNDVKELLANKGTTLYRGTGLTKKELQTYQAKIGKTGDDRLVALTGFTSTSMDRAMAETFAWSN